MSRINVVIDELRLRGFEPGERRTLVERLQAELYATLAYRDSRSEWVRPHYTPVLRLGQIPFEPGPAGGGKLGGAIARAIGRGLRP